MAWLNKNTKEREVKPQVDIHTFKDGREIIVLAKGRLVNPGVRHGSPVVRDVELVHEPGARADGSLPEPREVPGSRRVPPAERAGRESGRPAPGKIGVKLTKLSDKQSTYLGLDQAGRSNPTTNRY